MRKLLLLTAFIGSAIFAKAQSSDYKPFKFDIGIGYAIPTTSDASTAGTTKAGVAFTLHPHYRINDDLAVGLRFEGAGLGYENQGTSTINVSLLYSYSATVEYYLLKGGFRPFVGAGAGFYVQSKIDSVSSNSSSNNNTYNVQNQGTKFGFFPEVGFEAGKFRLYAAYNVLGKTPAGQNNSYLSFNIGFFIGGGRKR